ncbi:helix-turn-helix domain-containing protein [Rathayibacter sp. AY1A7]|uniref:AlbA family DNA-binding domain-containing protein n=1 Tax=Rathayibacter sp. AY1A7 TaxID=2080524 RepID=UPI0015E2FA49|nr:ATP-binding protein [Rathayibacter sp. AY1A7]
MSVTALHSALGLPAGPITESLIDAAVARAVKESNQLDWKSKLPDLKGLSRSEFPKDVAAMANSGGGLIIYGIRESQKAAFERCGTDGLDEAGERALRQAAVVAINPPLFGLSIHQFGAPHNRVVVVEVSASADVPHLIYKNDFFGAPVRNDADTVWMKEREIEAQYRTRIAGKVDSVNALNGLFEEAKQGHVEDERFWFVGVARPRAASSVNRLSKKDAQTILLLAREFSLSLAKHDDEHPLVHVDIVDIRPGLRRWVAPSRPARNGRLPRRESWISLCDDGSVTLLSAVSNTSGNLSRALTRSYVEARTAECAVSDLFSIVRSTGQSQLLSEFDLQVGFHWTGDEPLIITSRDIRGRPANESSTPLRLYSPVNAAADIANDEHAYVEQIGKVALDCINQGGVGRLDALRKAVP